MRLKRNSLSMAIAIGVVLGMVLSIRLGAHAQAYPPPVNTPTKTSRTASPTAIPDNQTGTPEITEAITPTATLVPLPAITLIFPISTSTETMDVPTASLNPDLTATPANNDLLQIYPRYHVLGIALITLWVLLIGFVFLYIRQLR